MQVRKLGVIIPTRHLIRKWGLNAEATPLPVHPLVSMVLFPAGRDNWKVEIRANLSGPRNGLVVMVCVTHLQMVTLFFGL